jgi:hypothetical protein
VLPQEWVLESRAARCRSTRRLSSVAPVTGPLRGYVREVLAPVVARCGSRLGPRVGGAPAHRLDAVQELRAVPRLHEGSTERRQGRGGGENAAQAAIDGQLRHLGRGACPTPTGRCETVTVAKVGSPRPARHCSCASQHPSGPPSVRQCSAQLSQMKHTSGLPQWQEDTIAG